MWHTHLFLQTFRKPNNSKTFFHLLFMSSFQFDRLLIFLVLFMESFSTAGNWTVQSIHKVFISVLSLFSKKSYSKHNRTLMCLIIHKVYHPKYVSITMSMYWNVRSPWSLQHGRDLAILPATVASAHSNTILSCKSSFWNQTHYQKQANILKLMFVCLFVCFERLSHF